MGCLCPYKPNRPRRPYLGIPHPLSWRFHHVRLRIRKLRQQRPAQVPAGHPAPVRVQGRHSRHQIIRHRERQRVRGDPGNITAEVHAAARGSAKYHQPNIVLTNAGTNDARLNIAISPPSCSRRSSGPPCPPSRPSAAALTQVPGACTPAMPPPGPKDCVG